MEQELAALLPGWIEPSTARTLLGRAGGDPDALATVVQEAWDGGELRQELGMWWCPLTDGTDLAGGGAGSGTDGSASQGDPLPAAASEAAEMRDLCDRGLPDQALRLGYERTAALLPRSAGDLGAEAHLSVLAVATVFAMLDAGRVHAAVPAAEALHATAVDRGSVTAQGWVAGALAAAYVAAGRIMDARRTAVEARLIARHARDRRLHALAFEVWQLSFWIVGEPVPPSPEPRLPASIPDVRPWAGALTGGWRDSSGADVRRLVASATDERDAGRFGVAATLAGFVALFGQPEAACEILNGVDGLEGDLFPLWLPVSRALVDRDLDELAAHADRLESLGILGLSAALSVWVLGGRVQSGADRAATRAALGVANRRTRHVQLGDQFLAQFRTLVPLREREYEIAQLAAAGATNKEIAEQLVISLRTVENHLYRVYDTLGIDGRDELKELFDR